MEASPFTSDVVIIRILFIILPIIMGTIHSIWKRNIPGFSKSDCFLGYFLIISIGLQSLLISHLQIYQGEMVAAYIGWKDSPFLTELAYANLAFGIIGILSFWFREGWREATALGYGFFQLMLAIEHYRLYDASSTQKIMGLLALTDFTFVACLFGLLILRRFCKA
jgi:hypothetical protein